MKSCFLASSLFAIAFVCISFVCHAQDLEGEWVGGFKHQNSEQEYVIGLRFSKDPDGKLVVTTHTLLNYLDGTDSILVTSAKLRFKKNGQIIVEETDPTSRLKLSLQKMYLKYKLENGEETLSGKWYIPSFNAMNGSIRFTKLKIEDGI